MSTRARMRHGAVALALAGAALGGCGGGGADSSRTSGPSTTAAAATRAGPTTPVAVKWEPAFGAGGGRAVAAISRTGRRIRVEVVEAACHPQDPRLAQPRRRVRRVTVAERAFAVIVTVYMTPVPQQAGPGGCTPANVAFAEPVVLAHPLGPRALVDGGAPRFGDQAGFQPKIRIPAVGASLERRAEAVYGPPDGGVTP